jgi:hypothetical protein
MIAAVIGGEANRAVTAAVRIGHTSGWDTLAAAAMTSAMVANHQIMRNPDAIGPDRRL